MISATDWFIMGGMSVLQERSPIVSAAACLTSARKTVWITEEITEQETAGSVKNRYKGLGKTENGKTEKEKTEKTIRENEIGNCDSDIEKG